MIAIIDESHVLGAAFYFYYRITLRIMPELVRKIAWLSAMGARGLFVTTSALTPPILEVTYSPRFS